MTAFFRKLSAVRWARKRAPDTPRYYAALAHERFQPGDLLRQAVEAEQAGFDGICGSDHLAPWWEPGDPAPASSVFVTVTTGAARRSRETATVRGLIAVGVSSHAESSAMDKSSMPRPKTRTGDVENTDLTSSGIGIVHGHVMPAR